jgi:hypothetical protein
MKKWLALLAVCCLLAAGYMVGCTGSFPIKWKPTEEQKQAADLTVKDLHALEPHTELGAQPIRLEALASAETTQQYIGLPKERPKPLAPTNVELLEKARADASRAPPTVGQVATAVATEAQDVTDAGFTLADSLLTIVGTIAGTIGCGAAGKKILGYRTKASDLQGQLNAALAGFGETVSAIEEAKRTLDPEAVQKLKAALGQAQSTGTKKQVYELKAA